MNSVFADAFFYFALLIESDDAHRAAHEFWNEYEGTTVTTEWVLTELGDGLAGSERRTDFHRFVADLKAHPLVYVETSNATTFEQGVALYAARPDKGWSLTDCISFVVMEREGITEALTGDRHFEQADFRILL